MNGKQHTCERAMYTREWIMAHMCMIHGTHVKTNVWRHSACLFYEWVMAQMWVGRGEKRNSIVRRYLLVSHPERDASCHLFARTQNLHCSVLPCVAVHYCVLQRAGVCCSWMSMPTILKRQVSVLQCIAVYCSVLQNSAVCCSWIRLMAPTHNSQSTLPPTHLPAHPPTFLHSNYWRLHKT